MPYKSYAIATNCKASLTVAERKNFADASAAHKTRFSSASKYLANACGKLSKFHASTKSYGNYVDNQKEAVDLYIQLHEAQMREFPHRRKQSYALVMHFRSRAASMQNVLVRLKPNSL